MSLTCWLSVYYAYTLEEIFCTLVFRMVKENIISNMEALQKAKAKTKPIKSSLTL